MTGSGKLKVILFALTGFGNPVLKALLEDDRVDVQAVFTVKYDQPLPYYAERQLLDECAEHGIACHHDIKVSSPDGITLLQNYSPDLILVATFKQIIRENVLKLPKLGVINFHPSLLPKFRGPCPTNAALLNDEEVSGVTVHYVTEGVDEGNILLQRSVPINEIDHDGQLRQKLSLLSGEMVPEVVEMFSGFTRPDGVPQNHSLATLAPKPSVEDGYLELAPDVAAIRNRMRALNPLPGTSFFLNGQRIVIGGYEWIGVDRPNGVYESGNVIDVILCSQAIRLLKKV